MLERLNICIYALHINIHSDLHPCANRAAYIYIYMQCKTKFTIYKPLALQETTVSII